MITKFEKYNESIKSLLVGPSKEEIWKNLGYDKSFDTPEEFMSYVISHMKMKKQEKYGTITYTLNGRQIFILDTNITKFIDYKLWVKYKRIFLVFRTIFNMDNNEIKEYICKVVKNELKLDDVTIDDITTY